MSSLDASGLPGVVVVSEEFRSAVEAQRTALGFTPRVTFLPHPIQDRTDSEMRALATEYCGQILDALQSAAI